jgi:hypothetical protein
MGLNKSSEGKLPEIEFEGPLGYFWHLEEVPLESLVQGIRKLFEEATRRGYKEEFIIEAVKHLRVAEF